MKLLLKSSLLAKRCYAVLCSAALTLGLGMAQSAWAAAPLTVNADGTVTDSSTSLVWDQCARGQSTTTTACDTGSATPYTWADALAELAARNSANYKGFSDWRLPNVNELETLARIDTYTADVPAIDTDAFAATPLYKFWTSTTYAIVPSQAWVVDFSGGDTNTYDKLQTFHVRMVRGGQPLAAFDLLPVNGTCASVAASAFMPSGDLCTFGTASAVSDASPWAWTCTGSGTGHTDASCTAPNQTMPAGSGAGRAVVAATNGWLVDTAGSAGFIGLTGHAKSPPSPPTNYNFPHGLLDLRLTVGTVGSAATVTLTYPTALPAGTVYWKYGRTAGNPSAHWYQYAGAVISADRLSITLTLTDNADGDDAYTTDGVIVDPGGPAVFVAPPVAPDPDPWVAQRISGFSPASPVVLGAAPVTLTATGGASGQPVVFATTSASTICTVSGSTVTFVGVGVCQLTANQAASGNYTAAAQVTASITINAPVSCTVNPGAAATAGATWTANCPRNSYRMVKTGTGFSVTDTVGSGGSVLVAGADAIEFDDVRVNLLIGDLSKTIHADDVKTLIELYVAFFNRVPEADGLGYWIGRVKAGATLDQIADAFYHAAVTYSGLTDYSSSMSHADFVRVIYANALSRSGANAPPEADVQYWANQLASGASTRGGLIVTMLWSAHRFNGDPTWGWVPDLLDNKVAVATFFGIAQGLNYKTAEESIVEGMAIANGVTSGATVDFSVLTGFTDVGFNLALP